jgi:hypothetical protein
MTALSANCNLPIKWIDEYPTLLWNYKLLSLHPRITWDYIQSHPDKPWNSSCVSINPNVTWDIIQANSKYSWDYKFLPRNPNITWDIMKQHKQIGWNHFLTYFNSNISYTNMFVDIPKHKGVFSQKYVGSNATWRDIYYRCNWTVAYASSKFNRWNSASKIQHIFRRWYTRTCVEVSFSKIISSTQYCSLPLPNEIVYGISSCMYIPRYYPHISYARRDIHEIVTKLSEHNSIGKFSFGSKFKLVLDMYETCVLDMGVYDKDKLVNNVVTVVNLAVKIRENRETDVNNE